ncbi:MAG: hypothetical protein IPK26_30710 [Planctomycetes bacterium]|nr:hypothetical protein [Planctomycetota bacterium]
MSRDEDLDETASPTASAGTRIALGAALLAVIGGAVLMMRDGQGGTGLAGKPGTGGHRVLATSWGETDPVETVPQAAPEAEPADERDPQVVLRQDLQNLDVMIDPRR